MTLTNICVIGATGAVGKETVKQLMKLENTNIFTITRRKLNAEEFSKVTQVVIEDFENLNTAENQLPQNIDVAISALGTTRSDSGSIENFKRVDFDYVVSFSKLMKNVKQCKQFHLISAKGSNADSYFTYCQVKGQLEEELKKHQYDYLYIYRPALLLADREKKRFGESIFQSVAKILDFPRFVSIPVSDIAKAMLFNIQKAKNDLKVPHVEIVSHNDCLKLAKSQEINSS